MTCINRYNLYYWHTF